MLTSQIFLSSNQIYVNAFVKKKINSKVCPQNAFIKFITCFQGSNPEPIQIDIDYLSTDWAVPKAIKCHTKNIILTSHVLCLFRKEVRHEMEVYHSPSKTCLYPRNGIPSWHISAINCQIVMSTCQIFMLTCQLLV